MIVNPTDSLYYENGANGSETDVWKGIGLGFQMPTTKLFGLGEREDTLLLKRTNDSPYELFARDKPHRPGHKESLYGSHPLV